MAIQKTPKILVSTALVLLMLFTSFPFWTVESEAAVTQITKSAAYQAICEGAATGKENIDISEYHVTGEEFGFMAQDLHDTEGELFCVETYSYGLSGGYVTDVRPVYKYQGVELLEKIENYKVQLQKLIDLGNSSWDDLELVTFYHDYLAANYEYDHNFQNYDAYSMMRDQKGVCQAYTLLFHELMEYYNIPCTYSKSEISNHIWNVVQVDGEWYHSDITWDDPSYEKPGTAHHTYFLLNEENNRIKHQEKSTKPEDFTDIVVGDGVTVSASNHPYTDLWDDVKTPIIPCGGEFFTIKQESSDSNAKLVKMDLLSGKFMATSVNNLSKYWFTADTTGAAYPGNYSGLVSDGIFLYYTDFKGFNPTVYRYHTGRDETEICKEYADTSKRIYGLRLENEKLMIFTGPTPNEKTFTKEECVFNLPSYYSITWVVDGVATETFFQEGTLPAFNGSTWKENENGKQYEFIGWSPEVVPATGDAVYTAQYLVTKTYVPGDITGDRKVDISDVTLLLNVLSGADVTSNVVALDTNGDAVNDILDVTALLNHLSDNSFELN